MTPKTLITTVLAVLALAVGVQSAWAGELSDASDRGTQSQPALYQDASDRGNGAPLSSRAPLSGYRDAFERTAGSRVESAPLVGHADRYELDLPRGPAVASTGSGIEIEWPQVGIGFGVGILLVLGLGLAVRLTRVPPLAH